MRKTGIELIAIERQEQLEKHKWVADHDDEHTNNELKNCAIYALTKDDNYWPFESGFFEAKIEAKNYKDSLIVAGAFIAAELDRISRLEQEDSE